MSKYRFRGKDIENLTREEALAALMLALDRLSQVDAPQRPLDFSDARDIRLPFVMRLT